MKKIIIITTFLIFFFLYIFILNTEKDDEKALKKFNSKIIWSTNEARRRTTENDNIIKVTGGIKSEWYHSFLINQNKILDKKRGIEDHPDFPNDIIQLENLMFESGYFISTFGTAESNDIILLWLTNSNGEYPNFTKDILENALLNSSEKAIEIFRVKSGYSFFKNNNVKNLNRSIVYKIQKDK